MSLNIGSALLIVGVLYLHLVHGLDGLVTGFFCIVGLLTWAYHGYTSERKQLFNAKIRLLNAKIKKEERELRRQNTP